MTKKAGFLVTATFFLPIDKKDFAKQAATFKAMADIQATNTLPPDFTATATLIGVKAKQGSADIADTPSADANQGQRPDPNDAATTPLTSDPLPEGATVLEAATALDGSIFQTVRLADGAEVFRRISAEQDAAERAPADGGKGRKR